MPLPRVGAQRCAARPSVLHLAVFLVAWAASVAWSLPCSAQSGSQAKAAAEALFDEGLALMKSGKNAEACSKLEQSQRVEPGVGTLLYLGECYGRVGRTASAWATFREASSLASASAQEGRAETARKRAAELEPDLAYLTISVPESVRGLPGLKVLWGGEPVAPAALGTPVPVDPTPTRLEVTATGYQPFVVEFTPLVRSRGSLDVPTLKRAQDSPPPSAPAAAGAEASVPPHFGAGEAPPLAHSTVSDPGSMQRTLGLVVAGVGAVGMGVGGYFGVSAMSKNAEAEDGYCDDNVCQRSDDLDLVNSARRDATVSNVALAVGGATVIGGLLLYWMAPGNAESAWAFEPTLSSHELNLGLRGVL